MPEITTYFADVLLPLSLKGCFTYRIPRELAGNVLPGMRVLVQFGKRKYYTALVRRVHETPPQTQVVKYILSIMDEIPLVNEKQFELWDWIAEYYLCYAGEVMNAALPAYFKLASETRLKLAAPIPAGEEGSFNERENQVLELLSDKNVATVSDISKLLNVVNAMPVIKSLMDKGLVRPEESLEEKYRPRLETFLKLVPPFLDEDVLAEEMSRLARKAPKQSDALMVFLQQRGAMQGVPVKKSVISQHSGVSAAAVAALVKKQILSAFEAETSRLEQAEAAALVIDIQLSAAQAEAYDALKSTMGSKQVTLLRGVTSSGKTEIYIKLIEEQLKRGKQVLYLLPEIALTGQIINRLQKYFGKRVGVYHSRYSDNEKVEIWNNIHATGGNPDMGYDIVLGARSALFLPFTSLGLVIVDEEHDTSYKQNDPAPRYNARETAIVLARIHGAKVLLGSATPALETFFNARRGKFGYVELTERYGGLPMPEIRLLNIKLLTFRRQMKSHFAPGMIDAIREALGRGNQVILFQNRRGFSLRLECDICNEIPQCHQCDVTLVYHKNLQALKCHYCGYTTAVPAVCPSCGSNRLQLRGFGTEKIEEALGVYFPEARIARLDLDTTRAKNAYRTILTDFEERRIDILVGTQMVTKGLDFANVSLVGILNADGMLSYPDFRAFERAYQLMAQVSGRAGRKDKQGLVLIQSYNPENKVLGWVLNDDYQAMYQSELRERERHSYPPVTRLIEITLKHPDPDTVSRASKKLAELLRPLFGNMLSGPETPIVSRVRNFYIRLILFKIDRGSSGMATKEAAWQIIEKFREINEFKRVRVAIDVDPL